MAVTALSCYRGGDSGKGKVAEYLSRPDRCDINARGTGADNAGYNIVRGTRVTALHLLPAGCVHEGVELVMGRGMLINMPTLFNEDVATVEKVYGWNPVDRLIVDGRAHLLFAAHRKADAKSEEQLGDKKIGSTKKGVAPCASDKHGRTGLRVELLAKDPADIKDAYGRQRKHWQDRFGVTLDSGEADEELAGLLAVREALAGHIKTGEEMRAYWRAALGANKRVLAQNVQGSRLHIDHDAYPNVTSTPTTTAGLMHGIGLPIRELTSAIGTFKPYDTFVGTHKIRTSFPPEVEERIRQRGREFGTTTGRARGVYPLDVEDMGNLAFEEGAHMTAMMKGDVYDPEETIRICVGTDGNGDPIYEDMPGWMESTSGITNYADMPAKAVAFHKRIEELTGVRIGFYGTGPRDCDIIDRRAELGLPA